MAKRIWILPTANDGQKFRVCKTTGGFGIEAVKICYLSLAFSILGLWAIGAFMMIIARVVNRDVIVFPLCVILFMLAMTMGMIWHCIRLRRQKPLLSYASATQQFSLPRQSVVFDRAQIEGFVVLDKSQKEERPCLELRIKARNLGARRVMRVETRHELEPIVRLLESETGLNVLFNHSRAKV
jgi:hypothetical protein